jgi:SAM-dependent MidA family methyltransferase
MKMPTDLIREEIMLRGAISFARFMELALYCPETGYYESQKDNVGRGGDFITSVSVGSLFGELLACQFAEWLKTLKLDSSGLKIVEAGAHDGKLAADILGWLKVHQPVLYEQIDYCILEPSPRRQAWQKERLNDFGPRIHWFAGFDELKAESQHLTGIIFGNELLDAFPVHRLGWNAREKSWFEWAVTSEGGKLVWTHFPRTELLPSLQAPASLLEVLPDNYTIEISPAAELWWHKAAKALTQGKLLAIDYGFNEIEMFSPGRTRGTLRAYHRHRVSDDLLANPGEQDLTAHVNFSAIQKAGESAGLVTERYGTQPEFLTRILERALKQKLFGDWTARQTRQFQTLTHPEHLGRAFNVLVQTRDPVSQ